MSPRKYCYDNRKPVDKQAPVWSHRIMDCIIKKKITQQELANISGVAKSTITGWIYGNNGNITEPKAKGIKIVAKKLEVTTDYLLGATDCLSKKPDLRAVCDYTGLSEEAVENIRVIHKIGRKVQLFDITYPLGYYDILNALLSDPQFINVMDDITNYVRDRIEKNVAIKSNRKAKQYIPIPADPDAQEAEDIKLFKIQKGFLKIIERLGD